MYKMPQKGEKVYSIQNSNSLLQSPIQMYSCLAKMDIDACKYV